MSKIFYELPETEICPVIYTLSLIGQKWKIPILWHLAEDGNLRYGELKKKIWGITNLMLTKSLRELEKDNLISRKDFSEKVLHVEYSLTERGKSLIPILKSIDDWGKKQMESRFKNL